jgi:hypothetical protein
MIHIIFFGFGLDSSFTPDKIALNKNRNNVQKGDWSYITDNMLLNICKIKQKNINTGQRDFSLLNRFNTDKTSHLLVYGLLYNTTNEIIRHILYVCNILHLESIYTIPIIFSNLLIHKLINYSDIIDINENINSIVTYIIDNIQIRDDNTINILKEYISYINYDDITEHKNPMLKSLSYAIIALKKVISGYSYIDAVMEIVREGGNAHSNAFITGIICGCYIGYNNLPNNICSDIQYKEILDTFFDSLNI